MHTYVIYDIVKDRIRKKIADICLDYGLKRIQYSAFLGDINTTRRRALEEKLTDQLGKAEGKIEVLAVCAKDFDKRTVIEETGE
jgi:CRISPR-associated protein Cas2